MIAKKFKILSLGLIFSIALNVGLIGALVYFMAEKTPPIASAIWAGKKEVVVTNLQTFRSMSKLSFRELVSFLTNRDLVEEGYTKRDLAIAALVAYHHFNLEKALSSPPAQVRTLVLSKEESIHVFPGLTEEQFEAIIRFAYQEKWPLTSKGLFVLLQAQMPPRDESLEQAFSLTPEFYALQLLFQKTNAPQEHETLLNLAVSGDWELLEEQSKASEFSEEMRCSFLLKYLPFHSKEAAHLLLKTHFTFALKRLEDQQIFELLALLNKQSEEGTRFCIELLRSPRSDAIWQAAALTLYSYAGEMPALPIDPQVVLARFSPERAQPAPIPTAVPSRFHIVKKGESLWKISRQYQVKVDEIVQINGLENSSLHPGMMLKLPHNQ